MDAAGRAKGRGRSRATPPTTTNVPGGGAPQAGGPPRPQQPSAGLVEGMTRMKIGDQSGQDGKQGARGGLQRRLRHAVIESDVQPVNVVSKVGNLGNLVNLKTNFACFRTLPEYDFSVYDVRFNFPLPLNRKFEQLKSLQQTSHLAKGPFTFDGMRAYTPAQWTPDSETPCQLNIGADKVITIRRVSGGVVGSEQYYHLLNIILNNVQVLLGQDRVGRAYYVPCNIKQGEIADDKVRPVVINFEHLSLHGGFETAFQRGTVNDKPVTIMHVDRSHRILSNKTAFDFLSECGQGFNAPKKSEILGRTVMTRYNNKNYTVNDIKENVNIDESFEVEKKDGTKSTVSYRSYFKDRYNINLRNSAQTFIVSRSKRRDVQKIRRQKGEGDEAMKGAPPEDTTRELLLPSELCYLCGLSESEKTNYQRNKQWNEITKRGPKERVNDVRDFQRWINSNPTTGQFLREWGMEFQQENMSVQGRELPCPPVVSFNPRSRKYDTSLEMQDRRGGGVVRGEWDPKDIKIDSQKEYKVGVLMRQPMQNNFLKFLSQVSSQMNFKINEISADDIVVMGRDSNICADLKEFLEMGYEIVLVAGIRPQDYAQIKSLTVNTGLLTQCIVKRNFEDARKGMSIATKVAIQMACKLGLDAWRIRYSAPKLKTMVVGMDTYHNKSQKKALHAAVFSLNPFFTQYINVAWVDDGRTETNPRLPSYFKKALDTFQKKHNFLPERIMIYRDGVGDSQLEMTKQTEIEVLKAELASLYEPRPAPHLMVLIVQKRVAARFFSPKGPQIMNPVSGTVVDTGIVKPNFYEFFLVSQLTRQGCSTPSNYNVIEDTCPDPQSNGYMSPSDIQLMSYGLTHLYYNWPGTIRVPAPVHYAHKLAYMLGESVPQFNSINESITDKLFYL